MNNIKRIYLSGPITFEPNAHQTFAAAETLVREIGCEPVNPLRINPPDVDWNTAMRNDIRALVDCDAILMLPGWRKSRGSIIEYNLAINLDIDVYFFTSSKIIIDHNAKVNMPEIIADAINKTIGVHTSQLQSKTRKREIVEARIIFSLLMRQKGGFTLEDIGNFLGLKHCTIVYHLRVGTDLLAYNSHFTEKYNKVCNYLKEITI